MAGVDVLRISKITSYGASSGLRGKRLPAYFQADRAGVRLKRLQVTIWFSRVVLDMKMSEPSHSEIAKVPAGLAFKAKARRAPGLRRAPHGRLPLASLMQARPTGV